MPTSQESKNIPSSSEPSSTVSLKELILSALEDKKAEEITEISLHGKSSIADSMIIASGRSSRQVASLADHVIQTVKDNGFGSCKVEGLEKADWVLIDAGDVIVHLFRPEVRAFYNLEKMWMPDFTPDKANHPEMAPEA
ncbi:ribosome silencing factor [Emcibacter nanhaiensis]|uniref:Ribosomal silencing factor RsfS n=1 Tax=Emcibacter nanhaiensis TaxID=1505037 RepID=A0A501PMB1_9PROT|nr:ribosome silencing factor [Emcibacter nanhaiensis]TPD61640.1 ribosome silencing factor [Emcibacter nanhaiensis]